MVEQKNKKNEKYKNWKAGEDNIIGLEINIRLKYCFFVLNFV